MRRIKLTYTGEAVVSFYYLLLYYLGIINYEESSGIVDRLLSYSQCLVFMVHWELKSSTLQ